MESNFGLVLSGLGQGLPLLLLHFVVTLLLLALGVFCYTRITPFHEEQLVRGGNIAAGIDIKLAIATQGKRINLPGGLPVIVDGHVIGGIGVGSGTGEQDREVANAALGAFSGAKTF